MKKYCLLTKSGAKWYLDNMDIYRYPNGTYDPDWEIMNYVCYRSALNEPIKMEVVDVCDGGYTTKTETEYGTIYSNICKTQVRIVK